MKESLQHDGCAIVESFSRISHLSSQEKELLSTLANNPITLAATENIRPPNSSSHNLYLLNKGWACSYREMHDGSRQILDIFLPGQILGLRDIGYEMPSSGIMAITDIDFCPFPKSKIFDITKKEHRISDLLILLLAREESILIERVINIGRRSAKERLANLLIELHERIDPQLCSYELHLTQEMIADTLGLTPVHICRTFAKLEEKKLIERQGSTLIIKNREQLNKLARFNSNYLTPSLNWLDHDRGASVPKKL